MSIYTDSHIHTPYCGHAFGSIEEYILVAIEKGLKKICFTDHLFRYYLGSKDRKRYWDWGMNKNRLEKYYHEVSELSLKYEECIEVYSGLEIDYIEGSEELLVPILDSYEFDFFLGSIHCLPEFGWKHLSHYKNIDATILYNTYFSVVEKAIKSKLFDSIAHVDFVWRYGIFDETRTSLLEEKISHIVKLAKKYDTAMEFNASVIVWSGRNIAEGKIDPHTIFLSEISKNSVPITIGSDAHNPEAVASNFSSVKRNLSENKIERYVFFEKHSPNAIFL